MELAAAELAKAGLDEPRRRARRLIAAALDLSESEIFARPERLLAPRESVRISAMLGRLIAHEPLTRIIGRREFWGLEFELSPDTLDPRPDSETLVEAVLARLPDRSRPYRLLDLGTGTGCLLLALLSELPQASGVGIDVAPGAARIARSNAVRLGLGARTAFAVADWAQGINGRFDAVVANPPYIATPELPALPPEVAHYDPPRALDGGADGLAAYRALAPALPGLLAPAGFFAGEVGQGQAEAVAALLTAHGLGVEDVVADLGGVPRCVVSRPGSRKKGLE